MKFFSDINLKKITAVVTTACFIFTGVLVDLANAVVSDKYNNNLKIDNSFITLPSDGLLTKAIDFGSDEVIINIQDLHSHAQTQRNIAKIINYIDSKYKIDGLYLEGAYSQVNTSWLKDMRKNELGRRMVEELVDAGRLGGVEYYSALSDKNTVINGIEDKELYEKNIKLLNRIIALQPEINRVFLKMERQLESVKKDYFNKDTEKLDKLVTKYKKNNISANKYYEKLVKIARQNGIDLSLYPNVRAYSELLTNSKSLNIEKVSKQFGTLINVLKAEIKYSEFAELARKSNNFKDIENIAADIQEIALKNQIFEKHKLNKLKDFFAYIEFSKNINLIEFVIEEKQLLKQLYGKLSKNKYEAEVAFLYEFMPIIKEYFFANIISDDHIRFGSDFKKFKKVWNSYFSENTAKYLYKYEQLLSEYHGNNIKRDGIFAQKIINAAGTGQSSELEGQNAIDVLKNEIGGKKLKIVVTGGFHSSGLERIAREKKVSYIQITPKITKDAVGAEEIHWNVIRGYREVLNNTINAKPLTETWIKVLFPEIIERALAASHNMPDMQKMPADERYQKIKEVVDNALKEHNADEKITVTWQIRDFDKDKTLIDAIYTDNSGTKQSVQKREYFFDVKTLTLSGAESDRIKKETYPKEDGLKVTSVLNGLFKNTKTFFYNLYTGVIAPVWEEFVFRFMPFALAGSIAASMPVSLAVFASAAAVSLISFPFAHFIADRIFLKSAYDTRTFKDFIIPSLIFTSVYLISLAFFPAIPLAGLAASVIAHSVYNLAIIVSKNISENTGNLVFKKIVSKFATARIANIFDINSLPEDFDINQELESLIQRLTKYTDESDYTVRKYYSNFENTGHSLASEIRNIQQDLKNSASLSESAKYDVFAKSVNRLYEIMVICAMTDTSEEYTSSLVFVRNFLGSFYQSAIYVKDSEGLSVFDKIIDFAITKKKIFFSYGGIIEHLIDDLYKDKREFSKKILKASYDAGFFKNGIVLRSVIGFDLAKFFYTTVSNDGGGIIVMGYDEPLLSKNEIKRFIKNDAAVNNPEYNVFLNDVISRIQYFKTLDVFANNPDIHQTTENVLKSLKDIDGTLKKDKYSVISEQLNILSEEFIKADVDVNVFRIFMPVFMFVNAKNSDDSIAVRVFNFVLQSKLADKYSKEKLSTLATIDKTDFLFEASSNIFLTDKELGVSLLAKMKEVIEANQNYKERLLLGRISERDRAYNLLPYGWSKALQSYSDLELFYDAIGRPYEELNEKSTVYERLFYRPDYLIMLANMLPDAVTGNVKSFSSPATYFRTKKHEAGRIVRDAESENKFEIFNDILENNILALAELNRGNEDSLRDSLFFLGRMIEGLKKFDTQYRSHGLNAQKAFESIDKNLRGSISAEMLAEQNKLNLWSADKIDEINSVHTLINAVHQTSISVFMNLINEEIKKDSAKEFIINPSQNNLIIYDFSKKGMRPEVKDFLAKITEANHQGTLYISGGRILYNKKLGAHSVSIFVDFDNTEDSITCTFYDSGRSDGNALRTTLLATLFAMAGFDISSFDNKVAGFGEVSTGLCELKAVWSCGTSDLRNGDKYAEFFSKAFSVVNNTKDLDYNLQGLEYDNDKNFYHEFAVPQLTLEDFKNIKATKKFPQQAYDLYLIEDKGKKHSSFLEQLRDRSANFMSSKKDDFGPVYDYFGLNGSDRNIETVEKMYVEGRIIKNDLGILEINKNYRPMSKIIEILNGNEWERDISFKQAQLLNLIDYSKIHFRTEGYIGGMIVKSGTIKLADGWLSVKAVVDAERERMQMAFVEYIGVEGSRIEMDYEDLISVLQKNGYEVERQSERSSSEKKKTINILREKNPFMKETPTAKATGLSLGTGGSITGKVTYNEVNLKNDNIWITQQIMKESVEKMDIPAGFCITSGGIYSHASIVAREKNKPAVLLQGRWTDNEIEIKYYIYSGRERNEGGFFIRETVEHTVRIKAGDIILINPETDELLLFAGAEKNKLEKLQQFIDGNNIEGLKQYLRANESDSDIGRLVEYVYYQCAGNSRLKDILDMLVAWGYEDKIGAKIDELNGIYKKNKLKSVRNIIENIEKTEDIKESYVLIKTAEKQINNIVLRKQDSEIKSLKIKIAEKKREILAEYIHYIESFKLSVGKLIKKDSFSAADIDLAVKLIEMAKYWKYFYGYNGVRELTDSLDKKVNANIKTDGETITLEGEIKTFSEIASSDKLKFGSKTTELAKINNSGRDFGIMEGVGIASGVLEIFFRDIGKSAQYSASMRELEDIIKSKDMSRFNRASEIAAQIIQMIKDSDSKLIRDYITDMKELKEGQRYAVRSSGIGEDGAAYSFAGMAKTKLNRDRASLYSDIKEIWMSFFESDTIKYMIESGQIVRPAVLVQKFIDNIKSAGVIFSSDANGDFNIEIVRGIGEGLASGKIDPDRIKVFPRDGRIEYKRALQNKKKIVALPQGGIQIEKLENIEKINRITNESDIRKILNLAYSLRQESGYPVDIEFAIDSENNISILQRRPDTAFNSKINEYELRKELSAAAKEMNLQSAADSLLTKIKIKNQKLYRMITISVVPAVEELIFRFIPFFAVGLILANPLSILPVVITSAASIFTFSYAHTVADKLIAKSEIRDWKNFLTPAVLFTGVYAAVYFCLGAVCPFVWANFAALLLSASVHSIYNKLALDGKIRKPVAEILNDENEIAKTIEKIKRLKKDILEDKSGKICFVCSGNTDRSAVAEMLFKSLMRKSGKKNIRVVSGGVYAVSSELGNGLKNEYVSELGKYGVDKDILNGFTTEMITPEHLNSDYFIAAGERQKNELIRFGVSQDKIITFAELAPSLVSDELPDPYGNRELKIKVTALINQIFENNFSSESLLKEPEQIQNSIDLTHIADLIKTLQSITSGRKDIIKNIIDNLSLIEAGTPVETRNEIVFNQIIQLKQMFDNPREYIFKTLIPLAVITKNPETGKSAIFAFIETLEREKAKIDEMAERKDKDGYYVYSERELDRYYSSLKNYTMDLFAMAYPVNSDSALEIVKTANKMGFIDHNEIPWSLRDVLKDYEDVRKYFIAISEPGTDKDLVAGIEQSVGLLSKIKIPDEKINADKEKISANLDSFKTSINTSNAQAADFAVQQLLLLAESLMKSGDLKSGSDIVKALMPLSRQIVAKTKNINEKTLQKMFSLFEIFYKAGQKENAGILVAYFIFTLQSSDSKDKTRTNSRACEYITKASNIMFDSIKNLDQNNSEYINTENEIISIFRDVAENTSGNVRVFTTMFDNLGINVKTMTVFITALKKENITAVPFIPQNGKIEYSQEFIDLITDSSSFIIIERLCQRLYFNQNGKQVALAIIEKLFKIADDPKETFERRRKAAVVLGRTAALIYSDINDDQILSLERINNLYKVLNIDSSLQESTAYFENIYGYSRYGNQEGSDKFDFTPLITKLPVEAASKNKPVLKSPVYAEHKGHINRDIPEVVIMIDDFNSLQDILKYNIIVLERIKTMTERSTKKDFDKIVEIVAGMIKILKKINAEHGDAAETALNKILASLSETELNSAAMKEQFQLSKWSENKISEIKEIHTLINAIHQTSILDFKQKIKDIGEIGKNNIRTAKFSRGDTEILAYNLSDSGKINRDIHNFLAKLASDRISIDDFVFKDDILVWTTRLFAHSVDIFINFGEKDRGISIYYNENGRKPGYAERVKYFTEVLRKLGLNVESDTVVDYSDKTPGTCGLKAVINKDFGLNEETDIAGIAAKVVLLYKYSTNLDMELEEYVDRYSYDSYVETVLNKLVDKFIAGEIWYGYNFVSNGQTAFRENMITSRSSKPNYGTVKQMLDEILENLGLEKMPERLPGRNPYEIEQSVIDKYFNNPIEQAYGEGRIVLDEKGKLVRNRNYDMMNQLIEAISKDEYDTLRQSRIINLLSRSYFNFKTVGFIGNLMFVTGTMKLSNGESLSVRGVMNPYTRRLKYAFTEIISGTGRKQLTNSELAELLISEGYKISTKQQLIGQKERARIKSFLSAQIQNTDSPEILCVGTSDGKGTYVAGNITFKRENAGPDDILLVSFTTPDDVKTIETVKAVITTGGGTLSHAAITTRELKKPSVVLNGASFKEYEKAAEVTYYTYEKGMEDIKGFNVIKARENTFVLKEGAKVLVNRETGRILLFNDINPSLLTELQSYIGSGDIENIKSFFEKNKDDANIRKLVEYIYFQTIGEKSLEKIMFVLFDDSMPASVKQKVKELNVVYVKEKLRNISESLENLQNIDNINIRYSIITKLNEKLNYIRTIESRQDVNELKKTMAAVQTEIKDALTEYVAGIISIGNSLSDKRKLSSSDIEKIVKLLHQISVYRYFIPKSETRKDLLEKRAELESLVTVLENILREYQINKKINPEGEICNFNEISSDDSYRFGSKTTELAVMYRLLEKIKGVKVPAGVGLSTNVFEMFFNEAGNSAQYKKLALDFERAIKAKNAADARKIARNIQKLIDNSKTQTPVLQKQIEIKIKNALEHGSKFSVRSSGVGEDSENKAFAGMGETKLNVIYQDVFANIQECWKSFYSDRCIDYMIEGGNIVKPAVLVQEMVDVSKAGVIFSRNKYGNTIIEGVYGLGEGIVSGMLTPDTIEVETSDGEIIEYSVADKYLKIISTENGTKEEVVTEGAKERVLDAETVKRIMDIVRMLEKDAGYPVDIEYGIKDDIIYILQRRPITTFEEIAAENNDSKINSKEQSEIKQMAALVFEKIQQNDDILFNIADPSNDDEAISVYLKKKDNGVAVFCIDAKYSGSVSAEQILEKIVERINTDAVVRAKFNGLSIILRVGEMEMGILPIPYIDDEKEIIPLKKNDDIRNIKTILFSA